MGLKIKEYEMLSRRYGNRFTSYLSEKDFENLLPTFYEVSYDSNKDLINILKQKGRNVKPAFENKDFTDLFVYAIGESAIRLNNKFLGKKYSFIYTSITTRDNNHPDLVIALAEYDEKNNKKYVFATAVVYISEDERTFSLFSLAAIKSKDNEVKKVLDTIMSIIIIK